jgi:GNAT superfamily N-acetyltransferase
MNITYTTGTVPETEAVIALFDSSGIKRPTTDPERIRQMFAHADLVVTAWHDDLLVGVARSLTDFCYCCYLSDLAVRRNYQHLGIGRRLIELTKEQVGERSNLLLLAAPPAMDYYPKVGFERVENGFIIKRRN